MWDEWTTNPGLLVVVVVMSSISSIHSFCVCICVWIMRCHYYRWLCRPKQRGHCFMWNQSCGGACLVDSFQDFHHAPLPICLSPSITHHHSLTPPPIIFLCILLACLQISKKKKKIIIILYLKDGSLLIYLDLKILFKWVKLRSYTELI